MDSIDVYRNGCVVVNRVSVSADPVESYGRKDKITELSIKSRTRMLFVAQTTGVKMRSMITLTYPIDYPRDGKAVKTHLNRFLVKMRRSYAFDYLWFLEFQRRGAPHIHMLTSRGNIRGSDREIMALAWVKSVYQGYGWSLPYSHIGTKKEKDIMDQMYKVHLHSSAWSGIKNENGAARYVAKYAMKTIQKLVPKDYQNVGRFWGCSRPVTDSIEKQFSAEMTDGQLRDLLLSVDHTTAGWDIIPKYIFGVDCFT